jgi:colicin import membrane protein
MEPSRTHLTMSTETAPAQSEQKPAVALEVVTADQVRTLATQNQLSAETADALLLSFKPHFDAVMSLLDQASRVEVTDATQVTMIRHARELRLQLRAQRVSADKVREQLKAESLRRGKAIDGVFALLKFKVEPIEERLLAAEEFAERAEQARKDKLREDRSKVLIELGEDPKLYAIADMEAPKFEQLVEGIRAQKKAAAEKAQKEADEKSAREKAEADRIEAQRIENERLRRESEERQAALKAKHTLGLGRFEALQKANLLEKADSVMGLAELSEVDFEQVQVRRAEAKAERQAALEKAAEAQRKLREAEERAELEKAEMRRQQAEKEAAEKKRRDEEAAAAEKKRREEAAEHQRKVDAQLAELKRKADEEAAARKKAEAEAAAARAAEEKRIADEKAREAAAAAAPDVEKIGALVAQIRSLTLPELKTEGAKKLATTFAQQRERFATWLETSAAKLTTPQSELGV